MTIQGVLYLIAVILLILAAIPVPTRSVSLALIGAALALLAFAWHPITG